MGGLRSRLPLVYWTFLIGALALIGFPLFSGFFSKDEIIAAVFLSENGGWALGLIAVLTSAITGYYVFRAFFLTFHGESRVPDDVAAHLHRPGLNIYVPLIVLAAFSAVAGFIQIPGATNVFESFLHPTFAEAHQPEIGGGVYWLIAAASAGAGIAGLALAYSNFGRPRPVSAEFSSDGWLRRLLLNDYYIEHFYRLAFVRPVYWLGNLISIVADPLIIDGIVRGVYIYTRAGARVLGVFQTGYARTYLVVMVAGAVLIVAYALGVGI
jgi:NADH-quinone oxidoreductase subunit L